MNPTGPFGETGDLAITVLVDNRADLLLRSTKTIKYFRDSPLLAEHGFAALIDLKSAGIRILWDAGLTQTTLLSNMQHMKIDPATISMMALSHGHGDHTGAVTGALKAICPLPEARKWPPTAPMAEMQAAAQRKRIPFIVHPAAFRERWGLGRDGSHYGPEAPPPRAEWEAVGADVVLSEAPYQLAPGCWTTGTIPRRTFEKAGVDASDIYREGDRFLSDLTEDDQSIVINVKNRGLVILTGCAHSGVLNTIAYAREISSIDTVCGIIGGFHLANAKDDDIMHTVDEISRLDPHLVAPAHCTGFRATARLAAQLPNAFAVAAAGATFLF